MSSSIDYRRHTEPNTSSTLLMGRVVSMYWRKQYLSEVKSSRTCIRNRRNRLATHTTGTAPESLLIDKKLFLRFFDQNSGMAKIRSSCIPDVRWFIIRLSLPKVVTLQCWCACTAAITRINKLQMYSFVCSHPCVEDIFSNKKRKSLRLFVLNNWKKELTNIDSSRFSVEYVTRYLRLDKAPFLRKPKLL